MHVMAGWRLEDCYPPSHVSRALHSSLSFTRNGNLRSVRLYVLIWWLSLVHHRLYSVQFEILTVITDLDIAAPILINFKLAVQAIAVHPLTDVQCYTRL